MKLDATEFRRLAPADRLAALRGERVERRFQIDRAAIDEKARTAWLSIASDLPYARWWGVEILDMNPSSIRDQRLRMGAPLLLGHDSADQVGVVESFEITSDRKLRILARFGRSDRAEEIFRDVLDGIRRNASVGYVIHDLVLEKQEEDVSTYRVTDWEPLEGSLVAVPADPSVGVGRAHTHAIQGKQMKVEDDQGTILSGVQTTLEGERLRILSLTAAGEDYAKYGGRELARTMIANPGCDLNAFKARMLESMRGREKPLPFIPAGSLDVIHYGEGARVSMNHGTLRAFRDVKLGDGRTVGAEEAAYRSGLWIKGVVLGDQRALAQYRDMAGNVLSTGGATVPIEMTSQIIRLQEQYGVFRQQARVFQMGSDQLRIPRRKSGPTVYFLGDGDTATESDQAWDNVGLSTKKMAILTRASNELIEDNVVMLADVLAQDIAVNFAQKEDQCGFTGDGTSTYGGMNGLVNIIIDGNHNAGKVAAASTHKTWATLDVTDLANLMSALPWYARAGAKWFCSSVAYDRTFSRLVAAASGNRLGDLSQAPRQSFLGHDIVVSQVMPNGPTTDYSTKVMILFGDLTLAAAMGMRRELQLRVDQSRYLEADQTAFMATERFDIVNHGCGDNTNAGPIVGLIGTA